ncbi:MAG: glycosyltransferase family 2 protein [Leptolyngbyaceae cyanobacterium RU_5_1]|nr:glycosyltransferase family 2 protein [Leptolyngbyaceae cyanobacterium RU_5_1]
MAALVTNEHRNFLKIIDTSNNGSVSSQSPLVSVVIPAYNAEDFIERTLRSVLAQTYRNIEVLVVDDGSTDRTAAIVRRIANQDSRVRLLQQVNIGVAAARNLAIQHASGEFIAPIDADDIWYPKNLEKQVNCALEGGSLVGVVYSWSVCIDETDALLGGIRAFSIEGNVFLTLLCHNFLGNASASLIRRSCLEQIGTYNTKLRLQNAQGCEDWDLYLRIAEHYQFRVVPEFLIGYRKLTNSMSRDYTAMANSYCLVLQAVQQQRPEIPNVLFQLSIGNFFMYLAYECDRVGDRTHTLLWIRRALQSDPITPLIRPSLYRLLLKNLRPSTAPHPESETLNPP